MNNPIVVSPVVNKSKSAQLKDILQLKLKGLTDQQIANKYGITQQAINKRLQGIYKLIDKESLEAYRENKANLLDSAELQLLSEVLQASKLKKMSVRDATVSYGIIYDKNRLEKGLSTENTAILDIVEERKRIVKEIEDNKAAVVESNE